MIKLFHHLLIIKFNFIALLIYVIVYLMCNCKFFLKRRKIFNLILMVKSLRFSKGLARCGNCFWSEIIQHLHVINISTFKFFKCFIDSRIDVLKLRLLHEFTCVHFLVYLTKLWRLFNNIMCSSLELVIL